MRTFFSDFWIGFKNFINFIVKHKLITAILTSGLVALGLMAPAILAGTLTNMIAVEILSVATGIGLLELGVLSIHEYRIRSLKSREVKLANKIAKSNANEDLTNTMTKQKYYKLSKKLAMTRFKLAKLQCTHQKPLSFSVKPLELANGSQSRLYYKLKKIEAVNNYYKIRDMKSGKQSIGQRLSHKRLEKIYTSDAYQELNYKVKAPYGYTKNIVIPVGDESKIYDERYSISSNKVETVKAFKELVEDKPFSKKNAGEIRVDYNGASRLKPIEVRIVPEKELVKATTLLVLKEVQEFVNLDKEKTVFPINVQFLGKKGEVKNKVFKNIESLNAVIEQMENDELVL